MKAFSAGDAPKPRTLGREGTYEGLCVVAFFGATEAIGQSSGSIVRVRFCYIPGPPKEPKLMDQYPKIETIGSIGSIILAILEVQVRPMRSALAR